MAHKAMCLGLLAGVVSALVASTAMTQPACKGPNKNDPGCPGVEDPPPEPAGSAVIDSATVDWANETIIVRGSDLDSVTSFSLGGSGPLSTGTSSPSEVELPFDSTVAGEVAGAGSYALLVDGAVAISLYFVSSVVDPALGGCPCDSEWAAELGGLWGADQTACYEISAPGVADLAGTVLSDASDPLLYPHFPIGASHYAGDPEASVCRLVQVNDSEPFQQELVNHRINANQQADCASALQTNICATTESAVSP